jgi:Collagen triple helix repeat (20 copies)
MSLDTKKTQKDRPFPVHRALHFLLSHVRTANPEQSKEAQLLQEELDNAYAKELEAQQNPPAPPAAGEQGQQGEAGPQGAQGEPGKTGAQGAQGEPGRKGRNG